MDRRTLVKSGASSFTVALPIQWIRKNKLDKGSEICFEEDDLGDLSIRCVREEKRSIEPLVLDCQDIEKRGFPFALLSAYMSGAERIVVMKNDKNSATNYVNQEITRYIGLEIIDENKKEIILRNFSSGEYNITAEECLKRISLCIVEIQRENKEGLFGRGLMKAEVLEAERTKEIGVQYLLFAKKLLIQAEKNPFAQKKMNLSKSEIALLRIKLAFLKELLETVFCINEVLSAVSRGSPVTSLIREIVSTFTDELISFFSKWDNSIEYLVPQVEVYKNNIVLLKKIVRKTSNPLAVEIATYCLQVQQKMIWLVEDFIILGVLGFSSVYD